MIDIIWSGMIIIAIVFSLANGTVNETLNAVISGAESAVSLTINLVGTMAFWMGIIKIAEKSGITNFINSILKPIIIKLFPDYKDKSKSKIVEKISMTITANLLGLGNAATPLAISAINSMEDDGDKPSKNIILFVILNTASLQIIPTNIASIRSAFGSTAPFSIMPYVWICSLTSLVVTVLLCKIIEKVKVNHHELYR